MKVNHVVLNMIDVSSAVVEAVNRIEIISHDLLEIRVGMVVNKNFKDFQNTISVWENVFSIEVNFKKITEIDFIEVLAVLVVFVMTNFSFRTLDVVRVVVVFNLVGVVLGLKLERILVEVLNSIKRSIDNSISMNKVNFKDDKKVEINAIQGENPENTNPMVDVVNEVSVFRIENVLKHFA